MRDALLNRCISIAPRATIGANVLEDGGSSCAAQSPEPVIHCET